MNQLSELAKARQNDMLQEAARQRMVAEARSGRQELTTRTKPVRRTWLAIRFRPQSDPTE